MRYEWLFQPISDEAPCGPDLDEEGDDAYLNYVLAASGRIPARYYRVESDTPIDRSEIRIKDEVAAIRSLLERTRDVRLLCIDARFQSFAGDMTGFSDCLAAIAGLLSRFWDDAHPKAMDGDYTLRQNVLSGLDDWAQVIQPLQHLPLLRDRRLDQVTFRQYMVATGAAQKREDENEVDVPDFHRALAAEENREASDKAFAAARAARGALGEIRDAFIANSGYDYVPSFDRLSEFLSQLIGVFAAARPDLAPALEVPATGGETEPSADGGTTAADAPPPRASYSGAIKDHAGAAAALLAVETYFAMREPSAPALILVHQARSLVGKSLIHAIEALLPEAAAGAVMRLDSGTNFQIPMPLMKSLTTAAQKSSEVVNGEPDGGASFSATSRQEAQALLDEVDGFFRSAEPSSPIPILLAKARSYTGRDFDAILKDLLVAKS